MSHAVLFVCKKCGYQSKTVIARCPRCWSSDLKNVSSQQPAQRGAQTAFQYACKNCFHQLMTSASLCPECSEQNTILHKSYIPYFASDPNRPAPELRYCPRCKFRTAQALSHCPHCSNVWQGRIWLGTKRELKRGGIFIGCLMIFVGVAFMCVLGLTALLKKNTDAAVFLFFGAVAGGMVFILAGAVYAAYSAFKS